MIYAVLEDGSIHPIGNWRMTKFDKKIEKMILTDGANIHYELAGYDKYVVEREKVGLLSGFSSVSRETVYGFHDFSENKKDIVSLYEIGLNKIHNSQLTPQQIEEKTKKLQSVFMSQMGKLSQREVAFITMLVNQGTTTPDSVVRGKHLVESDYKLGSCMQRTNHEVLGKGYKQLFRV